MAKTIREKQVSNNIEFAMLPSWFNKKKGCLQVLHRSLLFSECENSCAGVGVQSSPNSKTEGQDWKRHQRWDALSIFVFKHNLISGFSLNLMLDNICIAGWAQYPSLYVLCVPVFHDLQEYRKESKIRNWQILLQKLDSFKQHFLNYSLGRLQVMYWPEWLATVPGLGMLINSVIVT